MLAVVSTMYSMLPLSILKQNGLVWSVENLASVVEGDLMLVEECANSDGVLAV